MTWTGCGAEPPLATGMLAVTAASCRCVQKTKILDMIICGHLDRTDALNIDDTADSERPAHTLVLAAGIPVVEHLTGLAQLPPTGAWFTAVPLRIGKLGTIPVRAFARLPG